MKTVVCEIWQPESTAASSVSISFFKNFEKKLKFFSRVWSWAVENART